MGIVRVKPGVAQVWFGPDGPVPLTVNMPFDSKDPVVKALPDAFETDQEAFERDAQPGRITSVNFDEWAEKATAVPGEKRDVQHAAPTSDRAVDLDEITAPEENNPEAFEDVEPEAGNGPITTRGFAAKLASAASVEATASRMDRKAAARAASDATPRVVKKG